MTIPQFQLASSVSDLTGLLSQSSQVVTEPTITAASAPISAPSFDQVLEQHLSDDTNLIISEYISLKMFKDYIEMDSGKGVRGKQISYKDFRDILVKSMNDTSQAEINGMLPPSNMFFISQGAKELRLSCYYPTTIKPLLFFDRKMEVVAPNIIISHMMVREREDWIITSTKYFCTDAPISKLPRTFINEISSEDRIFLLPFPNTYDGGNMCYGSNSMPNRYKDNNLRGLDYYYNYLWTSPFNTDLGIRAIGNNSSVDVWLDRLAGCAEKKEVFPYDRLRGWSKSLDINPVAPV